MFYRDQLPNVFSFQRVLTLQKEFLTKKIDDSNVFMPFGRPVKWFGCTNSGFDKKHFSSFLFSVVFQQKICWSSDQ